MSTKTYLPTKADQQATDAKIDALKTVADTTATNVSTVKTDTAALKTDTATLKTDLAAAQDSLDEANTEIAALKSQLSVMEKQAGIQYADITVYFNWDGQDYEAPTSATVIAELLNGAKIVFNEQGVTVPYEAVITTMTNFSCTFHVLVTSAARVANSTISVVLGESADNPYCVSSQGFFLKGGDQKYIYLNTKRPTADIMEFFRAQPYTPDPSSSSVSKALQSGTSFFGVKKTNVITGTDGATSYKTEWAFGHWDAGKTNWTDTSSIKRVIWDVPKNDDGTAGTPVERALGGSGSNWVSLDDCLNCVKNIKIGTLSYTNGTTTVADNKIVRYDPVWVKTTRESINFPIEVTAGVYQDNYVDCVVKWYANTQVDASYHLHPLFEKYERQSDGTYSTTALSHGYIARYPIGTLVNMTIDGTSINMPSFKADGKREQVPGSRNVTLQCCRKLNQCTATLTFDGEDAITILPDTSNRTWGVAGTREISFLQWMAYLYFGVNVQGALDSFANNIFPGICTSSVSSTYNGDTDFIVNAGKMSGAINTRSNLNSIVFLGVEDALWSSTGWYWEDVTYVARRIAVSDADGNCTQTENVGWLYAQDVADVEPGTEDIANETYSSEDDHLSYEARLKVGGYREATFAGSTGSWWRAGVDSSTVLRDAHLPAAVLDQSNLNIGTCDAYWRTGTAAFAFSATTAYAAGDYVVQANKLYKCTTAHAAGAWNADDFTLAPSTTVTRRTYQLAALGSNRGYGSNLGAFMVNAYNRLLNSNGYAWRARPLLQGVF